MVKPDIEALKKRFFKEFKWDVKVGKDGKLRLFCEVEKVYDFLIKEVNQK